MGSQDYIIQRGDTLSQIAQRNNTTVEKLMELNRDSISDPDLIFADSTLVLSEEAATEEISPYIRKPETDEDVDTSLWDNQFEYEGEEIGDAFIPSEQSDRFTEGFAWGAGTTVGLYGGYKGLKKAAPYIKNGAKRMGNAARTNLAAAGKELRTNKFNPKDQAALDQAKQATKDAAKKTVREARGQNAAGKKVNTSAARNVKNGYLSRKVHGNARKMAQDAAKRKLVRNPLNTAKSARATVNAGSKAVAGSKALGFAGRAATVAAVAIEGYNVYDAYQTGGKHAAVKQGVKSGTALAGAWAGAKLGAAIGAWGGPIGAGAGALIGGAIGYFGGSWLGGKAAKHV